MADSQAPQQSRRRKWLRRLIPFVVIVVLLLIPMVVIDHRGGFLHAPNARTYDGPSDKLTATLIVPTLDTPIATGKNVIWCSSFQVAWNHLKNDVIKEPVQLANAQPIADRLNNAKESEADLPADSYYAAAGWVKDGIVQTIQKEMAKRFPDVPTPEFSVPDAQLIGYAYLAANVKFTTAFLDNDEKLIFTGAGGSRAVKSFGLRRKDCDLYLPLRNKVRILSSTRGDSDHGPSEFAIDPCIDSEPNQIVLACVAPKKTLAETLAYIDQIILPSRPEQYPGESELGPTDTLLIPNFSWRIEHRFKELEGTDKNFLNKVGQGLYMAEAFQMIDFRLDRTGAFLRSEARMAALGISQSYIFDRPFLIYMKKRGAERPFFVMWVDNPELLTKW